MNAKSVAVLAVVLSYAPVMSAEANKFVGVLIGDPNHPRNFTNVESDFKTPPMRDSETLQIKFAKDLWIMDDPAKFVFNWVGVTFFLHILDGTEVNVLQLSTPDDIYKLFGGGIPAGSPITFSTPGTPLKQTVPDTSVVKVINFAPPVPTSGITITESITIPALTSHSMVPRARRLEVGITDGFVRLSVGIEDPEDLEKDILQALTAI